MTEISTDDGRTHNIDISKEVTVELLVVIPENVTEERKAAIETLAQNAAKELNEKEQERQVAVSIRVVTGGGNSPKGDGQEETEG